MNGSPWDYHDRTSYVRNSMSGHFLDWPNQPNVFKSYPGLKTIPLPEVNQWPRNNLSVSALHEAPPEAQTPMDLDRVAAILGLTHAVTAKARHGGVDYYYRSVASAGALYPFELYIGAFNVTGLSDGLYHHTVGLQALTALIQGNILSELRQGVSIGADSTPVVAFFLTAIFFRSSWKYRDRAYRYHLLDTGHLAESLALSLRAMHVHFSLHYDFDDDKMNSLLALDPDREVCLAVALGWGEQNSVRANSSALETPLPNLSEASRVAAQERDYPLIRQTHTMTSTIVEPGEQPPRMLANFGLNLAEPRTLSSSVTWPEEMTYAEAVFSRRSRRNFVQNELAADAFNALLQLVCSKPLAAGDDEHSAAGVITVGFLADRVEGLDPGFYLVDTASESFSLAVQGGFIEHMAHVSLDQAWLGNCAIHFLFLCNPDNVQRQWGPRGYRYAMMTAGRLGQRLYVGATAMHLGCCGVGAFYDEEAIGMLGLNERTRLLYLVATGSVRKWASQ